MAFKFITLCALVAAAQAGLIQQAPLAYSAGPLAYAAAPAPIAYKSYAAPLAYAAAPVAKAVVAKVDDFDPHPQYSYAYDVHDSLTGDVKSQQETRDGDVVQGSYSLLESDGTRRIVDYVADPHNGFNAVVRKEGAAIAAAPVVAKVAAPVAAYAAPALAYKSYAAPALVKSYAAPALAYSAPIVAKSYAAPLAYSSGYLH